MTPAALVLLAVALLFHAAVLRYATEPLGRFMVVRTDRLRGTVQLCRASLSENQFVCGAVQRAPTPTTFTPAPPDSR